MEVRGRGMGKMVVERGLRGGPIMVGRSGGRRWMVEGGGSEEGGKRGKSSGGEGQRDRKSDG